MRCPNGHENQDGTAICYVCGLPMTIPQQASSSWWTPTKAIAAVIMAVALIAATVAVVLVVKGDDTDSSRRYPASVQSNYLDACENEASESVCDCTLRYLEARLSLSDFQRSEAKLKAGGDPPQLFYDAAIACVGK
jgi:hypothetical protein